MTLEERKQTKGLSSLPCRLQPTSLKISYKCTQEESLLPEGQGHAVLRIVSPKDCV